jgi:hypothetical protein
MTLNFINEFKLQKLIFCEKLTSKSIYILKLASPLLQEIRLIIICDARGIFNYEKSTQNDTNSALKFVRILCTESFFELHVIHFYE